MIYLAVPHTHDCSHVMAARRHLVDAATLYFIREGQCIFSPISMTHALTNYNVGMGITHERWLKQDIPFLYQADNLYILGLEGWRTSQGIRQECTVARERKIPISKLRPESILAPPALWHYENLLYDRYPTHKDDSFHWVRQACKSWYYTEVKPIFEDLK